MQVADKAWVVTGAGQGMGRELALELLRRGARVAAVDRDREALEETAVRAGRDAGLSTQGVDVTDRAAVAALPVRRSESSRSDYQGRYPPGHTAARARRARADAR